ncbi:MAG: hypothetical protein JWM02_2133 [Frankiales bacterium]|nr:hypothetical protein [Frankiales bacterium]
MRPSCLRFLAGTALMSLLVGVIVVGGQTGAAQAVTTTEVYGVPAAGSFAIEGHGWGHGHGMSQWGAQGAASLGKTADQITGFYYPGTAKASLPNSSIRVLLQNDTGADSQVYPATGLTVTDLASGAKATLPAGPTRWRSVVDAAGLHVQSYSGGWKQYAVGGKTVFSGPLQFGGPATVRLAFPDGTSREYRGVVRSVRTSATSVASVNVLPMESYLRGVVPRESSSSWAAAALQAQAIAARSYSAYKRAHAPSSQFFDICDSTMCQVYGGAALYSSSGARTPLEAASTDQAVSATAGVIRTYQGSAIFSEFSSSNGGWSTDGGVPYLVAQRDDWDGVVASSVHSWTATLTAAQIQARYPSIGTLKRMSVTARDGNGDWGGRVQTVVLEGVTSSGAATSVTTTGAGIYNAHSWPASSDGMRSSWWHVRPSVDGAVVTKSAAPTLVQSPGVSTGTLTVTMKNTGVSSWSTSGLHLAVASPPGQADPLVGNSTRPGAYTGTAGTIAPGATASFRFNLTADGVSPGLQGRSYRLRSGTGPLFGATVSWTVPINAPLFTGTPAAAPTSIAAQPAGTPSDQPRAVFADGRTVVVPVAGSTAVRLSVKNTGNITWPVGSGSPIRVGTSSPRGGNSASAGASWLSPSRPAAISASAPVGPGQSGAFDVTLYGNQRPVGVTTEAFEPLWEGKHWIDGSLTALSVVRVDPSISRLATTESAPPASVAVTNGPSGTAVLKVRLRNVGGSPWSVGQEALSASATPLSTSAWTSSTAPPALSSNFSRPGQAKVYPGEVGEWRVPLSAYRKNVGAYPLTLQAKGPDALYGPKLSTKVNVTKAVFSGSVTKVGPTVSVPRDGTAVAYFEVKNTGNVAWPLGGSVRSGVLTSGGSPSYTSSWLSPSRPGTLTDNVTHLGATSVLPGQVGRFKVVLAGNGRTPRSAGEPFGVLWEGWSWLAGVKPVLTYRIV